MHTIRNILVALLLVVSLSVQSAPLSTDDWDEDFKTATELFLPIGVDWRLLKAQCYQESLFDRWAVSHAGAMGLCQFMPATAADMRKQMGLEESWYFIPSTSIRAAGYYNGQLHRFWKAERPLMDRHMLALASYNWGAGNVHKSQKKCGGGNLYKDIEPCIAPLETRHYVEVIVKKWWMQLLFK